MSYAPGWSSLYIRGINPSQSSLASTCQASWRGRIAENLNNLYIIGKIIDQETWRARPLFWLGRRSSECDGVELALLIAVDDMHARIHGDVCRWAATRWPWRRSWRKGPDSGLLQPPRMADRDNAVWSYAHWCAGVSCEPAMRCPWRRGRELEEGDGQRGPAAAAACGWQGSRWVVRCSSGASCRRLPPPRIS